MKKILALFLLLSIAAWTGCKKYDDTELRNQLSGQSERIEALAAEITELRQLVDALSGGGYVTAVTPVGEEGAATGITVSFSNAPDVQILFATSGAGTGIRSVTLEDDALAITLSTDETVRIPIRTVPVLTLARDTVLVFPGAAASVAYTLSGGDAGNSLHLFVEGLWKADIVVADAHSGQLSLTAPDPCSEAKVVVTVASAAGLSCFRTIYCAQARFSVAQASYKMAPDAGQIVVPVDNNLGAFTVDLPAEADWLSLEAVSEDAVNLAVTENTGDGRSATVKLKNEAYGVEVTFAVVQEEGGTFIWTPVTTLDGVKAGSCLLAYYRSSDEALFFLSGATSLDRNPLAASATDAGVTFSGEVITAAGADYVWTVAASGSNWTFSGSNGLWLIGANKFQGVAVLSDLNGYYTSQGSTYARTWSFVEESPSGLRMMVTESETRHLAVPDADTKWVLQPDLNGYIILYYKTRQE